MKNKKAFTLVELIVVITILSILATIGFIGYSSYLGSSRDTNRVSQLKNISQSLEIYGTKKSLPLPEDSVEIKTGAKIIAYQGYVGKNIIEQINYSTEGIDPQSGDYFSYYLTKDKKYFQLMAFLEDGTELQNKSAFNISKSYADYTDKFPTVYGKKLGILTDIDNTPIQEIASIKTAGFLNISNVGTTEYIAIFSDKSKLTGSGTSLAVVNPKASCKRLYEAKGKRENGVYKIDPEGNGTGFEVYCDMTTDGGGWTLIMRGKSGNYSGWYTTGNLNLENSLYIGDTFKFSDDKINLIKTKAYRIIKNNEASYNKFFIKSSCIYNHNSAATGECENSWLDQNFNKGEWIGIQGSSGHNGISQQISSPNVGHIITSRGSTYGWLLTSENGSGWKHGGSGGDFSMWVK